jgi:hypothetical protein
MVRSPSPDLRECVVGPELYVGELEQLCPERAGEDRTVIADDGAWNAMKPHDLVEEGARH